MEKELRLEELLEQIKNKEVKRTEPYKSEPWYNGYGDCIEFQTQDVAIVADRIDTFLTIYRSAVDSMAIGFQLKDVKALMKKHGCDIGIVEATVSNKQLMSIVTILMKAYEEKPVTISKNEGYLEALTSLVGKATASIGESK